MADSASQGAVSIGVASHFIWRSIFDFIGNRFGQANSEVMLKRVVADDGNMNGSDTRAED